MKHRIGEVEYQYKGLNLLLINLNTNSGLSSSPMGTTGNKKPKLALPLERFKRSPLPHLTSLLNKDTKYRSIMSFFTAKPDGCCDQAMHWNPPPPTHTDF